MKLFFSFFWQLAISIFLMQLSAQTTYYVTQHGAGNMSGSDWANASPDLQAIINIASAADEIWMEAGIYTPSQDASGNYSPADSRDKTFYLKDGVKIYGGFSGNEISVSQRDWITFPTFLSGDLSNNDGLNFTNNSDNCYHVVTSVQDSGVTELNGVTIQAGNADGTSSQVVEGQLVYAYHGGGLYLYESNLVIDNVVFTWNFATQNGGGMYNYKGTSNIYNSSFISNKVDNIYGNASGGGAFNILASPTFYRVKFDDNSAFWGGAMSNISTSTNIKKSTFNTNYTGENGGAIYNYASIVSISETRFGTNYSAKYGGAIYNVHNSDLEIFETNFRANNAYYGGAIANYDANSHILTSIFDGNFSFEGGGIYNLYASPIIENTDFIRNLGFLKGGAVCNYTSGGEFFDCAFDENKSTDVGGGIFNYNSSPMLKNLIFYKNVSVYGGAITNYNTSNPTIVNNTICENQGTQGGGIYNKNSAPIINNCIIWNNSGNEIENASSNPLVTYSAIRGASVYPGTGNTNLNPTFENPSDPDGTDNTWRTTDDGFRLRAGSPVIDTGDPSITFGEDIVYVPTFNNIRDMGAYEGLNVIYDNTVSCLSISKNDVKGFAWFEFCDSHGIICSINPNGIDMGTVTVEISDPTGAIAFNNRHYLSRSINVTSSNYPSGSLMPNDYRLRFFHYDSEIVEYNLASNSNVTMSDFHIEWAENGSGCTLATYNGTSQGLIDKVDVVDVDYGTNNDGFYFEFMLNHFTIFAATSVGLTPLPLDLLSFSGENEGHNNVLNWVVSADSKNEYFEIQRTNGNTNFAKLGEMKEFQRQNGHHTYTFIDANPFEGKNYYRLKSVDINGKEIYSEILSLYYEKGENIRLYPNPVVDELHFMIEKPNQTLIISDALGREIFHLKSVPDKLDFSQMPKGIYYAKIGYDKCFPFVKE